MPVVISCLFGHYVQRWPLSREAGFEGVRRSSGTEAVPFALCRRGGDGGPHAALSPAILVPQHFPKPGPTALRSLTPHRVLPG